MAVTHGDEPESSEDDPFAGLVLDESFVRAAKHSEAPARTREAIARYAHLEQPVFGTGRPPERGQRSKKRRWVTVTAVVVLVGLFGYIIWLTGRPSHAAAATQAPVVQPHSPSTSAPTTSSSPGANIADSLVRGYFSGTPVAACLTWAFTGSLAGHHKPLTT